MSPILALVIAIVGWGLSTFLDKLACRSMQPESIGFIYGILEIIILPIYYYLLRSQIQFSTFTKAGIFWATIASFVSLISFFAYLFALKHYEASVVGGYELSYVGISFLLCVIFLGESFTLAKVTGIALMVAGAYFLGKS